MQGRFTNLAIQRHPEGKDGTAGGLLGVASSLSTPQQARTDAGQQTQVEVYDIPSGKKVGGLQVEYQKQVRALAFSGPRRLLWVQDDGCVTQLDLDTQETQLQFDELYIDGIEEPHDYDFSHTYLGDKQILPLAAALSFDKQLASLNVAHTGMRDPGLRTLCQQLKRSPRLEYMDVAGTRFSIEGAMGLLEMVKHCPRILFVRTEDTCLQEQFALQRGLSNKYASVRLALHKIFEERVHQESGSNLQTVPAQKDSREADL